MFLGYAGIVLVIAVVFAVSMMLIAGPYFSALIDGLGDPVATQQILRDQMERMRIGSPLWTVALVVSGAAGGVAIALQGAMTAIATRELLAAAEPVERA